VSDLPATFSECSSTRKMNRITTADEAECLIEIIDLPGETRRQKIADAPHARIVIRGQHVSSARQRGRIRAWQRHPISSNRCAIAFMAAT
jgi:hypothetical protein